LIKKLLSIAVAIAALIVLLNGIEDLPPWADPDQPASVHVSPRYIERGVEETGVPNIVTAVLADYRGYDTLFETAVIFTAGVAVLMILRRYMP
jgi:multicomponent Na+:H+ antiporter subunit B